MKFETGRWFIPPGLEATYPVSVQAVQIKDNALVITGYSQAGRSRGELIGGTIITARLTAPMPNVIRVQLTHFKGRLPHSPVFIKNTNQTDPDAQIGQDTGQAWLRTGRLEVRSAAQGEWGITFLRDGQPLTASGARDVGLMCMNGETYLRERLSLAPGETVYGLGERFGPFVKNGQSIEIWNEDGSTESEWAYKNVPFYLTNRGYGVLVDYPGRVSFEVASVHTTRVQFSVPGHNLDYYIFAGPTPKDVLEQYTALTGRPALPPEWSFGLWLSTSFTTNYDEQTILGNLDRMAKEGIPVLVFHFDCFWMKGLTWTSFLWDQDNFPDPKTMLQHIQARGVRICLWINPYISEASPVFEEGAAAGYLLHTPEGDVFQNNEWQPGMAFVDFTNPAACEWYALQAQRTVGDRCGLFQNGLWGAHSDRRTLSRWFGPRTDA